MSAPRLLGLATASPPFAIDQEAVAELAVTTFGGKVFRPEDIRTLYANTGIRTRRMVRPLEWYLEPRGWPERNEAFLEAAGDLVLEASEKAMRAAGVRPGDIGSVVCVSSTGIATPSLEARLHGRLGLSAGAHRIPVFGLGCAGGVSGLALAGRLARAEPGRPVLMAVVELCSLSYRPDDLSKASAVATALFGDGAAAAVVAADDAAGGRVLEAGVERLWADSLDIMGWRIDPAGFGVVLAASLPEFIESRLPAVLAEAEAEAGVARSSVDRFVCHPGGTRVLTALERSLGVPRGYLDHERAVLTEHGNMSAPTVFFVLERVLAEGRRGRLMLSAMGPGFTATFVSLGPADG